MAESQRLLPGEALPTRVVFPGEGHLLDLETDQALVGDRHAACCSALDIGEHLLRAAR